jgi:trigger factor
VFERLMRQSFVEAIEGQHLPVIGQPEFETEAAMPGEPLRYHATVEVRPDIVAQGYLGIEAERPVHAVTQEEVDAVLKRLRESHARLHPISDRSVAQMGDVVALSYEARADDKLLGKSDHRDVELGNNGFPAGFDGEIEGMNVGGEKRFSVTYSADSHNPELANKTVEFVVTIKGLSRKELPALDDDFAKTHGDSETLDELTKRVREGLEQDAARQIDEVVRRRVLSRLLELNEVPLPRALVERRLHALVEDVWEEWRQQRRIPRNEAAARQRLHEELDGQARDQVKLSLLLDAISSQEAINVSDDEVTQRIDAIAEQSGGAGERMRALYAEPDNRERLRASMVQSRAVDFVVHKAQIRDEQPQSQIADTGENR